jgi:hypothetical protein
VRAFGRRRGVPARACQHKSGSSLSLPAHPPPSSSSAAPDESNLHDHTAAINPTYTYGKRTSVDEPQHVSDAVETHERRRRPSARARPHAHQALTLLVTPPQNTKKQMAPGVAAAQANRAATASGRRTTSNRTISGRDIGPPGSQHGHKGHILFRPLPEPTVDGDAAAVAPAAPLK